MARVWPLLLPLALAGCQTGQSGAGRPAFPARLEAIGTEPFWSISLDATRLVWTDPDEAGESIAVTRREHAGVLEVDGELKAGRLHMAIRRAACSDGMSDFGYRYQDKLTIGANTWPGCAGRR